jgi:hypothetical protein
MKMWIIWMIQAYAKSQEYDLPDWIQKTSYQCDYPPERNLYLLDQRCSIELHTKFYWVPVSHVNFPNLLWSLSFLYSTLPSLKNPKLRHPSLSLYATIMSQHWVEHHPKIDSLPLPVSFLSLGRCCCTQLSTFPQLHGNQSIESQQPLCRPLSRPPPSTSPMSFDRSLRAHLSVQLISASKCIAKLARSPPPRAPLSSLYVSFQLHLQTRSIIASRCICKLDQWRPTASLSLLDLGLQVHFERRSISGMECISKFTRSRPPSACPNVLDHGLSL